MKKNPTPRINLGFDHLTGAGMNQKAGAIYDGMFENPFFPTPVPTLESLNSGRMDFGQLLEKASSRSKNDIAAKNVARQHLTELLVELGHYVTLTAKGDLQKLVSSRFDLRKQREPVPELLKPKNIKATDGINPGVINLSVDAVKGARSYSHEYTPDPVTPESTWTVVSCTIRKCTIKNLPGGKKMWFRVAAVGVRGQFTYSDLVSRTVQ